MTRAAPSLALTELVRAPFTMRSTVCDTPSETFKTTLPVKPSVATTSMSPPNRPEPST